MWTCATCVNIIQHKWSLNVLSHKPINVFIFIFIAVGLKGRSTINRIRTFLADPTCEVFRAFSLFQAAAQLRTAQFCYISEGFSRPELIKTANSNFLWPLACQRKSCVCSTNDFAAAVKPWIHCSSVTCSHWKKQHLWHLNNLKQTLFTLRNMFLFHLYVTKTLHTTVRIIHQTRCRHRVISQFTLANTLNFLT